VTSERSPRIVNNDAELLEAWRSGRSDAGEQLFRRHYDAVERFFLNKVGPERVADLVQETFVATVEARDRVADGARFRAYLLTIAYRVFCRYLRSKYKSGVQIDLEVISVAAVGASPSSLAARAEEQRLLLEGLRAIPVNYQVVLELHYWEQLTTSEIAEVLDVPPGTVRSRLRRGRDALSAAMASISRSPELLESTLTRLEDWGDRCGRELVGRERPDPDRAGEQHE
jgi:RNA polymerase sigma-70 factor, ECF subfamily